MSGCASLVLPAPRFTPDQCVIDRALVGTWTDSRMTQMGPGWMKVSLGCDCRYTSRAQLLFLRVTERGQYRAIGGQIFFEQASRQFVAPYELDGDRLRLTEHPTETHTYRRRSRPACTA